jgi:hypothetical protein
LFLSGGPLRPAALLLPVVETDDHAEMALRQLDGVHGRLAQARRREQFLDDAVHNGKDFLAWEIVVHADLLARYFGPREISAAATANCKLQIANCKTWKPCRDAAGPESVMLPSCNLQFRFVFMASNPFAA